FHGIHTSRRTKAESVTHVSGTFCHLCLGPLTIRSNLFLGGQLPRTAQHRRVHPVLDLDPAFRLAG
ncbi:hypothetical protein, partial [Bradyrhizobium sp. NAS80.1]|uniref:hypothetical protein n=1 Tax=Bradyrhizobium sp. NAS80.1 TaxID=1680159 RepID=UPI001AEFF802